MCLKSRGDSSLSKHKGGEDARKGKACCEEVGLHEQVHGIVPLVGHKKLVVLDDSFLNLRVVPIRVVIFAAVIHEKLCEMVVQLD